MFHFSENLGIHKLGNDNVPLEEPEEDPSNSLFDLAADHEDLTEVRSPNCIPLSFWKIAY